MTWNETLFTYCERASDPGLLAEPVNAATNLAFFVSAWLARKHQVAHPSATRDVDHTIFIVLVALMGLGSTLFHVFAEQWAFALDVAPIALFVLVYLNYALNRFLDLPPGLSFILTMVYVLTIVALIFVPGGMALLNGSISFVPAWFALIIVGVLLHKRGHPAAWFLLTGAMIFLVSLIFRTVDKAVCDMTTVAGHATGTHGLWHLFNAALLYLLVRAAIDHGRHGEQTYEVLRPIGPKSTKSSDTP